MGGFFGHAASGLMFMTLSTWWTMQRTVNSYYHQMAYRKGDKYFKLHKMCRRLPVEGAVVVFCTLCGLIGEQVYQKWRWRLFNDEGVFIYSNIWQHCTMWAGFAIYGTAKIAVGTCWKGSGRWAQVFLTFAFFIEAVLFHFHLHGRTGLNTRMHTLEVLVVSLCVLFTAGEIWLPRDEVLPWLRSWATFVQGSWMLQIGTTLYHPLRSYSWDEDDHLNIKFFSMLFAWHCMLGIIVLVVQVIGTKFFMRFFIIGKSNSYSYTGIHKEEEQQLVVMETKGSFTDETRMFRDESSRSEEE